MTCYEKGEWGVGKGLLLMQCGANNDIEWRVGKWGQKTKKLDGVGPVDNRPSID